MKRIAYVTDLHLGEPFPDAQPGNAAASWQHLLEDIKKENITHLIIGGDIGETQHYLWFFETLKGFTVALTLGNHDQFDEVTKFFPGKAAGPGELYYREEDNLFTYLFLDSSSGSVSGEQLDWLSKQFGTTKQVLVFIHHPVLSTNTQMDKQYPLQNREAVKQCLLAGGKKITLFCGHYHMSDERSFDIIHQLITPAVSFQVEKIAERVVIDGSRFGYRIICLNEDSIDTTVKMFER